MSDSGKAVFLSYASQDAEAAKKICDALRAAGVEVWFDQNELVGGDAWDAKIRRQIKECALLIPVISANTQARREGYFRLEWRLAVERMRQMDDDLPFLLPVVIDETSDAAAFVPERFREVQWTRLKGGEAPPAFCARVKKLLRGELGAGVTVVRPKNQEPSTNNRSLGRLWWALPIFGVTMALVLVLKEGRKNPEPTASPIPSAAGAAKSPARQLADKALAVALSGSGTLEQLRGAAGMAEKAAREDPLDGEIWAIGALVDLSFFESSIDASEKRRDALRVKLSQAKGLSPRAALTRYAEAKTLARVEPVAAGLKAAEDILREMLVAPPSDLTRENVMSLLVAVLAEQHRFVEAARLAEDAGLWSGAFWSYLAAGDLARAVSMAERQTKADQAGGLYLQMTVQFARGDLEAWAELLNRLPATALLEEQMLTQQLWLAYYRRDAAALLAAARRFPTAYIENNAVKSPRGTFIGIAHQWAGQNEAAKAAWVDALQEVERRLAVDPKVGHLRMARMWLLAFLDRKEEARQALTDFRLQNQDLWMDADMNGLLVLLDQKDEALDQLEQLLRAQPRSYWHLHTAARYAAFYDPLRGNPRFEKLLRETLLPGAKPFDDPKPLSEARQLVEKAWRLALASRRDSQGMANATEMTDRAVQLDKLDGEVWAQAALVDINCYVMGFDLSEARVTQIRTRVARAKSLAPRSAKARIAEAQMLIWVDGETPGRLAEAERILRGLANEPLAAEDAANVHGNIGSILTKLGRREEASPLFEQAGQNSAGWMNAASWNYLAQGKLTDALRAAEKQGTLDPDSGWQQVAVVQRARGDLEAAQAALDRMSDAARREEVAILTYATLAFLRRDWDAALVAYRQLPDEWVQIREYAGPKRLLTGWVHHYAGREEAARAEWQAALRVVEQRLAADNTSADVLWSQWELLVALGRRDDARQVERLQRQLGFLKAGEEWIGFFAVQQDREATLQAATLLLGLRRSELGAPVVYSHTNFRYSAFYDFMRDDPRWQKLLRETLLPGAKPFDDARSEVKP